MKIAVLTLGCKVNKYEGDALIFKLRELGYDATDKLEKADAYIINTCAVTNEAERKSRQMMERCRKFNENAKIYVLGCASQNRPVQFEGRNVTYIQGVANKMEIINHINQQGEKIYDLPSKYEDDLYSAQTLTRAFIKIQDGCNNFCTYCIIPYLRGSSRSRSMVSVISEAQKLPAEVKEIVLVGIDVSSYEQNGKKALIDLLEALDGLNKRLRLSSMEDNLVTENFVERLSKLKNFCPHFHLSLQSACNATLKRMNRRYSIEEFKEIVKKIKENFVLPCISTDIIVGFKGETDEEFNDTLKNLKEIEFSFIHIFPYSERSGTVASKMSGAVDKCVVKAREGALQELNREFKSKFFKNNINTNHKVLIEEVKDGFSLGYTENYIYTYIEKPLNVGDIVDIKLKTIYNQGMKGELLSLKR